MRSRLPKMFVKHRTLLAVCLTLLTLVLAAGASNLYLNNNYNIFFDQNDPQKLAHEAQQNEFIKTDNLVLLIQPNGKATVFSKQVLKGLQWITEESWKTPYAIRVDSLTNFQNSFTEDQYLVTENLVALNASLDTEDIDRIQETALSEQRLLGRVISADGRTTLINISVELPRYPPEELEQPERIVALEEREQAIKEIVEYGRSLQQLAKEQFSEVSIHLLGDTLINQSLAEASDKDAAKLVPGMFLVIVIMLGILLRSAFSVFSVLAVITLTIVATMGAHGWLGGSLNMVVIVAPIILLTIAVCDSVHVLSNYLICLSAGDYPELAMQKSLEINLQPVFLTSITTAAGFLTLNYSASPPFRDLGNLCAFGVMYAMLLTICLLPSLAIKFIKQSRQAEKSNHVINFLSEFVIKRKKACLMLALLLTLLSGAMIPLNEIDDDPSRYFKSSNPYRAAVDFSQSRLPGIVDINFTLSCGLSDCIHDPEYLRQLEKFKGWMLTQPSVETVASYIDVIKNVNSNYNNNPDFYRIPESKQLSAQYNLLYEMSLPYGLDINNLVNLDKSATRFTAFMHQASTSEILALEAKSSAWLDQNSSTADTHGSSIRVMFAALGENNIRGMIWGALIALIAVTLTIFLSLRSFRYSIISMIANSFPVIIAIGFWGLLVAHINMAVAAVFSITLGIIVDDSVHFISKYRHAREHFGYAADDAIRYAFSNVGKALFVTTTVLSVGFSFLCLSAFNLNAYLGALSALTIMIALVFDYLALPSLLLIFGDKLTPNKPTHLNEHL